MIVVLSVLLLTGVLGPAGASFPHGPLRYSVAHGQVTYTTSSYRGGGWKVFAASGIAARTSISGGSVGSGNLTIPGCNSTTLNALPSGTSIPAVTGSFQSGIAPGWVFLLVNSANALLVVIDINGTVTPLAELTGSSTTCPFSQVASLVGNGIASNVIDSDAAARIAWNAGGQNFISAHPNATAMYTIVSGFGFLGFSTPAIWSVQLEACSATQLGTGAIVPAFNVTINAASGQVTGVGNTSQPCLGTGTPFGYPGPSTTPLGTSLALGGASAITFAGNRTGYSIPIASASNSLTWNDLGFDVFNGSGFAVFLSSGNLTVRDISGTAIAVYSFATDSWSGSASALVSSTDTLTLYPPPGVDLSGGLLQVFSTSAQFSGFVDTALP